MIYVKFIYMYVDMTFGYEYKRKSYIAKLYSVHNIYKC